MDALTLAALIAAVLGAWFVLALGLALVGGRAVAVCEARSSRSSGSAGDSVGDTVGDTAGVAAGDSAAHSSTHSAADCFAVHCYDERSGTDSVAARAQPVGGLVPRGFP